MGFIPPPKKLTKKEFKDAGGRDPAFDRWARYESTPLGWINFVLDKFVFKKRIN